MPLLSPTRATCPAQLILLDFVTRAVQIIQLHIMQLPPLPCYLVLPTSKYSPQHPILKGPGVAQWLRHCATSRAVPGSNPGGVGHRDFSRG